VGFLINLRHQLLQLVHASAGVPLEIINLHVTKLDVVMREDKISHTVEITVAATQTQTKKITKNGL
jgi:hypothetical protein